MVNLSVNGTQVTFDGDPTMPLMWYLRDELGLTGTKFGCGVALCGACTVHLNGEAVRACGVPMSDVGGKSVVTIEGLDPKGAHPVQVAWRNSSVPQCGYCQTGQIMQAAALLRRSPRRATRKSPMRCPAISAGAAAISAFMRPCAPPRRERDMTIHTREIPVITNVSRRRMLQGLGGGLVLAAQFPAVRGARLSDRRRQDAERRRERSEDLRLDRARRHRHHRRGACRDGHGRGAHHAADDRRRRTRRRLGEVRIEQSPGDEKNYGNQDTDGSRSVAISSSRCGCAAPPRA